MNIGILPVSTVRHVHVNVIIVISVKKLVNNYGNVHVILYDIVIQHVNVNIGKLYIKKYVLHDAKKQAAIIRQRGDHKLLGFGRWKILTIPRKRDVGKRKILLIRFSYIVYKIETKFYKLS